MLVVADDDVIEEIDVEDVAGLDEFGGYFFVGAAGFGIAGWVVVDDHDGVCDGEEGAFALDTARNPSCYSDSEGYFVIPDITADEFVIVVGNPESRYYIVNDGNDKARVYKTEKGKIQQLGDLVIDFAP